MVDLKKQFADLKTENGRILEMEHDVEVFRSQEKNTVSEIQKAILDGGTVGNGLDDYLFLIYGADFLSQQKAKHIINKFLEIFNAHVGEPVLFISQSFHEWRKELIGELAKKGEGDWRFDQLNLGKIVRNDSRVNIDGIGLAVDFCRGANKKFFYAAGYYNTIGQLFLDQETQTELDRINHWFIFLLVVKNLTGFDNDDSEVFEDLLRPIGSMFKDQRFAMLFGAEVIAKYIDIQVHQIKAYLPRLYSDAQTLKIKDQLVAKSNEMKKFINVAADQASELEIQIKELLLNSLKTPEGKKIVEKILIFLNDCKNINQLEVPEVKNLQELLNKLNIEQL